MIKNMKSQAAWVTVGAVRPGAEKSANAPGRNQPHFRLVAFEGYEQLEADAKEKIGPNPAELRIRFPFARHMSSEQNMTYIYDDFMEFRQGNKLFCRGDGETGHRGMKKNEMEIFSCVGCQYAAGDSPKCKPTAYLKFVLTQLPLMGIWTLKVNSWHSIENMRSVLESYRTILGKNFWAVEFIMYKQTMVLRGRTQYITKLKLAPEYQSLVPSGLDLSFDIEVEDDFPGLEAAESNILEIPDAPVTPEPEQGRPTHYSSDDALVTMPEPVPPKQPEPEPEKPSESPGHAEIPPLDVPAPRAEVASRPAEPAQPVPNDPKTAVKKRPIRIALEEKVAEMISKIHAKDQSKDMNELLVHFGEKTDQIDDYDDAELKVLIGVLNNAIKTGFTSASLLTDEDIPF